MNYLDLFSGIGGFSLGIQRSGKTFDRHYFSEIDKHATSIYQKQFPDATGLGDIKGIKPEELGKIELITFGFPCQDLSIAGKRAGLGGARSGLFFEAMRLIRRLKPDTFIFENVEGLLTSNDGQDFEVVLREIADVGLYECEWQLLNTSWFLPQNRERVYFIGHLGERCGRKVFPVTESNSRSDSPQSGARGEGQRLWDYPANTLSQRDYKGGGQLIQEGFINTNSQGQRVYSTSGMSAQLTAQGGGWGAKTGLYEVQPCLTPDRPVKRQNGRRFKDDGEPSFTLTSQDIHGVMIKEATKQGYAVAQEGDSINLTQPNSKTGRGRVGKGEANTIDCQMQQHTLHGTRIRRLTPTECERLQGFPDGWTSTGKDGNRISDSQRYRCLGNAVSVPVVESIARRLWREDGFFG